jgi:hypothetical protein
MKAAHMRVLSALQGEAEMEAKGLEIQRLQQEVALLKKRRDEDLDPEFFFGAEAVARYKRGSMFSTVEAERFLRFEDGRIYRLQYVGGMTHVDIVAPEPAE